MVEITNFNIMPIILLIMFLVTITLSYSIIRFKHANAEHSETKWILHKTFNRTIDHEENTQKNLVHCFDKATDDLKQVAFTEAHEHEMHEMEISIKKLEKTVKEILDILDKIQRD